MKLIQKRTKLKFRLMEGFPLDIQRIILKDVCNYNPYEYLIGQLFPLLSVNRMFRTWTIRYVLDTIDKKWFAQALSKHFGWIRDEVITIEHWDVYGHLLKRWSPSILVSFLMFLDISRYHYMKRYVSNEKAVALFFTKDYIFTDLESHRQLRISIERNVFSISSNRMNVRRYEEMIDNLKRALERNTQEKEAEERVVESLNKKYKKDL